MTQPTSIGSTYVIATIKNLSEALEMQWSLILLMPSLACFMSNDCPSSYCLQNEGGMMGH